MPVPSDRSRSCGGSDACSRRSLHDDGATCQQRQATASSRRSCGSSLGGRSLGRASQASASSRRRYERGSMVMGRSASTPTISMGTPPQHGEPHSGWPYQGAMGCPAPDGNKNRRSTAHGGAGPDPSVKSRIPGLGLPSMTTPRMEDRFPRKPGGHSNGMSAPCFDAQIGYMPTNNIPGYTGYIPGKYSENVLGTSVGRSNALSFVACARRGEPELATCNDFARRSNVYGLEPRRGASMPGYAGYIPGKMSEGVLGHTFADANVIATRARWEQACNRDHIAPMLPPGGGLGSTGNRAAYHSMEMQR